MSSYYGIGGSLSTPLYSGGAVVDFVPWVYPVALNGRPYHLDDNPETYYVRWNHETIPFLRQQADQSSTPAEASLNPQGLWRRAQDSWHHGAGQTYRDRDQNADPYRFRASKGIDCWSRYKISLLNGTTQKRSSANTNLYCVVAGSRLYLADGSTLRYTTDMTTWSTVGSYTGGSIVSITSDGYTVYFSDGADIWTTNTDGTTATSADTTNATLVRYVKGRFIAAANNVLYNIPTLGSAASMTYTHPNAKFTWVDACEGDAHIFAAGYAGDKSIVYRTQIKADGTALDIPIPAATLPDGEIVRSIQGYLGFVWIGTDKGVRFCEVDGNGNLTVGPLISTSGAVLAFEPQDRFMWFGWTNYDATSTGLGRMDLTQLTDTDQPAYASDLMVTGQGAVSSIATFTNLRVFTVQGLGLYADSGSSVSSGTIDMGWATFGMPDEKVSVSIDVQSPSAAGAYTVWLAVDDGVTTQVGSSTSMTDHHPVYPTNQQRGELFEVRLVLSTSAGVGPTLNRWTLKVLPTTSDGPAEMIHLPLMLYPLLNINGQEFLCDVGLEKTEISSLRETREIVSLQYLSETYTGFIADFKWFPYDLTWSDGPDGGWGEKGTLLVDFQRIG